MARKAHGWRHGTVVRHAAPAVAPGAWGALNAWLRLASGGFGGVDRGPELPSGRKKQEKQANRGSNGARKGSCATEDGRATPQGPSPCRRPHTAPRRVAPLRRLRGWPDRHGAAAENSRLHDALDRVQNGTSSSVTEPGRSVSSRDGSGRGLGGPEARSAASKGSPDAAPSPREPSRKISSATTSVM